MTPTPPTSGAPAGMQDALGAFLGAASLAEGARALARLLSETSGLPVALALPGEEGSAGVDSYGSDSGLPSECAFDRLARLAEWALQGYEDMGLLRDGLGEDAGDAAVAAVPLLEQGVAVAAVALPRQQRAALPGGPESLAWLGHIVATRRDRGRAAADATATERQHQRRFRTMDAQLRLLDRERQKFQALVKRSDAAVMVLGSDLKIRWVNREMGRIHLGDARPESELHGSVCCDVCRQGNGSCTECPVRAALGGAPIAHGEFKRVINGVPRQLYVTAQPIRGPEGGVEEVLVTMQDLTGLDILRRSEARMRQLFDGSVDSILMVEPSTLRIVLANATACRTLSAGEDLGALGLDALFSVPELGRVRAYLDALLAGRPAGGADFEVRAPRGPILCNVVATPFDLDGTEVLMVQMRDVTAVRRLERELVHADRLASLGTMSAGIAHEFKNRLAPLRGLAQLVASGAGDPDRVERYVPRLLEELDRLARLVRDVLDAARPQEARRERCDLRSLVLGHVEEFRHECADALHAQGVRVLDSVEGERPEVVAVDAEQLRVVFQNLLKNALEACPEGGEIRVEVKAEGGRVTATVADTGCGMDARVRERILEPFFTTKGARGTGLGMCIVKSLVEANDGVLEIHSEPGRGTEISVTLGEVGTSGNRSPGLQTSGDEERREEAA
ncbi:MAG: PAS domain-containing protein [Candidatus Eisenbacteria bacterium]|nr:PAS domain-containing protein [Candidatus Eisenbacteria bacterium]